MGIQSFDESLPLNEGASIESTDGTNWVSVHGGIQSLCRIDTILVTNSDSVDHVVNLRMNANAAQTRLTSVNLPAGTGSAGVPPVDLIAAIPGVLAGGIPLYAFTTLEAQAEVAFGAGTGAQISVVGGSL
jgi:hypothetical protein